MSTKVTEISDLLSTNNIIIIVLWVRQVIYSIYTVTNKIQPRFFIGME